ncbi:MAG: DUF6431 domain-containing protein [Lacrimispora saccharolytica]
MIFFVESSAISYCPVCGEPLSYRDSCVRIMRLEGGMKRRFLIRRLKCSNSADSIGNSQTVWSHTNTMLPK